MKTIIKYMHNSFENASRNKRELSVVKKFDCKIIVHDIGNEQCVKEVDGFIVHSRLIKLSSNSLFRKFQILYNWFFREPKYLRKQHAYCISCHDLLALFIGWLSTWFLPKEKKPLLVYDSHEFEIGRNTDGKRSKFEDFIILKLEKFLMKKCAFCMMVNDSIANEVHRIHKLKDKPIVVRNIPNYWKIDEHICNEKKKELCTKLGLTIDSFIVMYHGGVMKGRGIEILLESIQKDKEIFGIILGNGEKNYIEYLKRMAIDLKVADRVLFHEAVPIDILWQYVGAADVGMVTIPAVSKSYYYMLPNKFFENIQALTPVICSNFPEVSSIVNQYDIGLLVNPDNVDEIANAIETVRTDKNMYRIFKENLVKAKNELCWENESKVLEEAYEKILR